MKTVNSFVLLLFVALLASCTLKQGPSEEEIQARIDSAVQNALQNRQDSVASAAQETDSSEPESSQETDSSEPESSSSSYSSSSSSDDASSYVGTYTVNDGIHTWEIILKSDETCTMGLKGSDNVVYGSWYKSYKTGAQLNFLDEMPVVFFPGGKESLYLPCIKDGYLYESRSDASAKNPKKRLAITKVR